MSDEQDIDSTEKDADSTPPASEQEQPSDSPQGDIDAVSDDSQEQDIVEKRSSEEPKYIPDNEAAANLMNLGDVEVNFTAILGRVDMPVEQFLKLGRGAIVELDQNVTSSLELRANNHHIGTGEIKIVNEIVSVNVTKVGTPKTLEQPSADEGMDMSAAMGDDPMAAAMGDDPMAAAMGDDPMAAAMGDDPMAAAMEEGN